MLLQVHLVLLISYFVAIDVQLQGRPANGDSLGLISVDLEPSPGMMSPYFELAGQYIVL